MPEQNPLKISAAQERPKTPAQARRLLEKGNKAFATILTNSIDSSAAALSLTAEDFGAATDPASPPPAQRPFAAVLGCADARVPTEMVFLQTANGLFVVRVAGNVLTNEGLGSLDYAIGHFMESLRLVVVLGHTHCGAVTSAVDAFLSPVTYLDLASRFALRSIVDRIFIAVQGAARSLLTIYGPRVTRFPGYREALIESAVLANAAITAFAIREEFSGHSRSRLGVVYGIYDLQSQTVASLRESSEKRWDYRDGLTAPPTDYKDFIALGNHAATSPRIRKLLRLPGLK